MSRRREMIEMLVDDDINNIFEAKNQENDEYYISNILLEGFKGYENYTEEELVQEMNERDLWHQWFKETV
jgi:hypothetical protein